ncbi:MAG: hypothetical protein LQ339_000693 [Xanthoria mediterranea]|nr:MAG: hypothetical protein LQ339_000693 [Xanthoria mediterranea]
MPRHQGGPGRHQPGREDPFFQAALIPGHPGMGDALAEVDVVEGMVDMMGMDMEDTDILENMEEGILEHMEEAILDHMEEDILDHMEEDILDHMDHPNTLDNMAASVLEDAT